MSLTTRMVIIAAALATLTLSLVISHDLYQHRMIAMLRKRQEAVKERQEAVVQHLTRSSVGLDGLRTWRAELDPQADPGTILDSLAEQSEDWAVDLYQVMRPMVDHLTEESALNQQAQREFVHNYLKRFEDQWSDVLGHDLHEQSATIRAALSNIAADIYQRRASLRLLRPQSP